MIPVCVERLVNAVLYEGYVLYPYRASSLKNRQRWTFGGLFPASYAAQASDPCRMQVQCLLAGQRKPLALHVRFLHLVAREVGRVVGNAASADEACRWTPVPMLEVDGRQYVTWEEAVEREVVIGIPDLRRLEGEERREVFGFGAERETEFIRDAAGRIAGLLERRREALEGTVQFSATRMGEGLHRLSIRIVNHTPLQHPETLSRAEAQRYAFVSTHLLLSAPDACFISLTDPPPECAAAAAACRNEGAWPVLVGEAGQRDMMLASPIILSDYPQIAPESRGDLYDGTEIDEILSLRIVAMGDAERRECAAADERARTLLERTAAMNPDHWQSLHGAFREPPPVHGPRLASLHRDGAELCVGARVRLRPRRDGDIMDLALAGRTGVIEGIEADYEDRLHVAVALDDDPGRDLGLARLPGHRFFFAPDEIDVLGDVLNRKGV
jgi:hydrogenase maturation protease